jgi:hypothetical protein
MVFFYMYKRGLNVYFNLSNKGGGFVVIKVAKKN